MHSSILITLLLGAGALSHPHYKLNNPLAHIHNKRNEKPIQVNTKVEGNRVVVNELYAKTVYQYGPSPAAQKAAVIHDAPVTHQTPHAEKPKVKVFQQQQEPAPKPAAPKPQPQPKPIAIPKPVVPKPVVHKQKVDPPKVEVPKKAEVTQEDNDATDEAPSTSGGPDGSPMSGHKSMLSTANYFRKLQGFKELKWDSNLASNAGKTNQNDGAVKMTHQLNAGSNAQCIAQGDDHTTSGDLSPFDLVYLGWLCEIPEGNLGSMCDKMKAATHMIVDTGNPGHANILRSEQYTTIGCNYMKSVAPQANFEGMWTCDLGM